MAAPKSENCAETPGWPAWPGRARAPLARSGFAPLAKPTQKGRLPSVTDQPSERARKPAPQLADYPHQITDNIRFGDLDPQGHVNQAVYLTYFETGRVAMFRMPDLGIGVPGLTFVMVRMEVDYIKELHWPGTITIGTGRATLVCMDKTTRKSTPLPEAAIARLSQWKLKSA
ncbi:MAG: acyl-CoA thioesterase [Rhizobiales bacterium]|nr:acyl-CoA thioesterase [Hyphomicrobiales bacterium]